MISLKEELKKIQGKRNIKVIPPREGRIDPATEIIYHPNPRGFPRVYLSLFGRPKKLAKWGFRMENDKPGKVVKIL